MRIPLTAGQAVTIYGLMSPNLKETPSRNDVMANSQLTFAYLVGYTSIPKELLHRLQPNIGAWVAAGRVTLENAPASAHSIWSAHLIKDLKADLGDVIQMGWPASVLSKAGVTYGDLKEAGLTHEGMGLLGYTLYDWGGLGFTAQGALALPPHVLGRLFKLTPAEVAACLR